MSTGTPIPARRTEDMAYSPALCTIEHGAQSCVDYAVDRRASVICHQRLILQIADHAGLWGVEGCVALSRELGRIVQLEVKQRRRLQEMGVRVRQKLQDKVP